MLSSWLGTDRFGGKPQRQDAMADRYDEFLMMMMMMMN